MPNIIQLETGFSEYDINGVTVRFNPTDLSFCERVFSTFDTMDGMQEEYNAAITAAQDNAAVFAVYHDMEDKMRGMIDDVFGDHVCEAMFGRMSVYALAGGLPIWANLMLALIDEMDASFAREKKLTNPRLKKYADKYRKRAGK